MTGRMSVRLAAGPFGPPEWVVACPEHGVVARVRRCDMPGGIDHRNAMNHAIGHFRNVHDHPPNPPTRESSTPMTDYTDYAIRTTGSSSGPHLHYRRPGLLARLRTWWGADYDAGYRAGYRQGYHAGYDHADLED